MKGKRLVDVLGEEVNDNSMILTKFILLLQRIEDLKKANIIYKQWKKN